jgi:signal peptidase I
LRVILAYIRAVDQDRTASYVIASHYVVGAVRFRISMAPTINDSDYYFLEHLTYLWRTPQRGDIVVIRDPSDGSYSIKRIIATQGELLYIKDGKVYVDGKLLIETYLADGTPVDLQSAAVVVHRDSTHHRDETVRDA